MLFELNRAFLIAVNCFVDIGEMYVMRDENPLIHDRFDVKDLLESFIYEGPFHLDKIVLKKAIVEAFQQGDDFWVSLNEESGKGFHITCCELWWGAFPEDDEFREQPHMDDDYARYHFVMLKFLVKKLIWDVLYPDEPLPNYQEPTSGKLPLY